MTVTVCTREATIDVQGRATRVRGSVCFDKESGWIWRVVDLTPGPDGLLYSIYASVATDETCARRNMHAYIRRHRVRETR